MTSLDLGDEFYTTSSTDMTNMFNGCGQVDMITLDLGPAFTKIAETNSGIFTSCGKSGEVKFYIGSAIYSSKTAFKLNADSETTISSTRGQIIPRYKPEWTKTYAAYDAGERKLTVRLEGKVNSTNYGDAVKTVISSFRNGVLTEDALFANQKIKVRIDGQDVSTINKELSLVESAQIGETVQCEIILTNFVENTLQSGKSYFEWSGNVALQIAEEMLVDSYGNRALEQSDEATGTMQKVEVKDDATTDHMIDTMMFVDFVKPVITYKYAASDINKTTKTATIVFNITDKYYASESLTINNLTILMDGTNLKQTPVNIVLNKSVTTYGCTYTVTLTELQQDIIATGKSYLDYSGPLTIAVPGGVVTDKSGNTNNAKTITVGLDENTYTDNTGNTSVVVDVVSPTWTNVDNGVTISGNTATINVKATDKYFDTTKCTLTASNIKFYLDGVETSNGITITVNGPKTPYITEQRLVNGVSTQVTIGAEYAITISGISLEYNQAKIKIVEGTITDLNGNVSEDSEIIIYNRLISAETEKDALSPFLGNTTIARQDIEKVIFVSSISGSEDEGVQQVWDVSAVGDDSILAWYKETQAPYTVYIGSQGGILANRNSNYLFAHIGYGPSCNDTLVIENLNILDTSTVTSMQGMFWFCGYRAMTTLDLGDNFKTSSVTNMKEMFTGCGYMAMTTLDFGDFFNTGNVTDMSWMFANLGYKVMSSLTLPANFITTKVTNMSYMFAECGYSEMTTLNLGNNFNTSNVTDMSYMFMNCGYTEMTSLNLQSGFHTDKVESMKAMFKGTGYKLLSSLNLGPNFKTSEVTDMSEMFYNCGHDNMTSLTLGDNFNTSKVTNMNSMFMGCGASKLASLELGLLFNTTQVTDMTNMFNGCGQGEMTTLDLGPAFTNIASTNTGFITNTGKSGTCVIKAPESIYKNIGAFKLNTSDTSETTDALKYANGKINPVYKPQWEKISSTIDTTNETLNVVLKGSVNSGLYTSDVTSTLTADDITVYIDGVEASSMIKPATADEQTANADKIFKELIVPADTTDVETVTYTLKLSGFEEVVRQSGKSFLEWSGNVSIKIGGRGEETGTYTANVLKDSYGNQSMMQTDETEGTWIDVIYKDTDSTTNANENGKMFTDFVKPRITYEYYVSGAINTNTDIDHNEKVVTVYFNITDKYFKQAKLTADDITVQVDSNANANTAITKTLTKVANRDIVSGDRKVGETYKLEISGLDSGDGLLYSGPMTLTFPAGQLESDGTTLKVGAIDNSGNLSVARTITIGIDDDENPNKTPHNHDEAVIVDVVDPVWRVENLTATTADLIITDKYLKTIGNSLTGEQLKALIQIKIEGEEISAEERAQVNISGPVAVTNGHKYSITIPNTLTLSQPETYEEFLAARDKYEAGEAGGRVYRDATLGAIMITIPEGAIIDQYENRSRIFEFNMGLAQDTLKPETVKVSSQKYTIGATGNPIPEKATEVITFDVTDKYFGTININADNIHVFIDGEEATSISKNLSFVKNLYAHKDDTSGTVYGKRYQLVLSDFETTGLQTGYDFKGLSGTVSIEIDEGVATDQNGLTSSGRKADGTNTSEGQPMIGDFVDFIKPSVIYRKSNTTKTTGDNAEVNIVFDITDKYFDTCNFSTALEAATTDAQKLTVIKNYLTIMIQDGTDDSNYIDLINIPGVEVGISAVNKTQTGTVNKTVGGTVTTVTNPIIGKTYTLTIRNLEQFEVAEGRKYLDYSGNVTIEVAENAVKDTSENKNVETIITMGINLPEETGSKDVLDIVRPVWEGNLDEIHVDGAYAVIRIKGTDKYFSASTLESKIELVYADGTVTREAIKIAGVNEINEYWTIDGVTNNKVLIGVEYIILIDEIDFTKNQAKIRIPAGALIDKSGNESEEFEIILYSTLVSAENEKDATSLFLGNPFDIQRQNIDQITFTKLSNEAMKEWKKLAGNGNSGYWDVSVTQNKSLIAKYSGTGPYQVTIGCEGNIFANENSSYLFSYIGSGTTTQTDTIIGFGSSRLYTNRVTDMNHMFYYFGHTAMTTLNLGNNFDTSNVTDMRYMFASCGFTKMETLHLGEKFDTSQVKYMDDMFDRCGYTKMDSFILGDNFDTTSVESMSWMFNRCGYEALKRLDLSVPVTQKSKFNTSNVKNMQGMFSYLGFTSMEQLILGDYFDTSKVTDMESMFSNCGFTKMTSLDLGDKFDTSAVTNMDWMFNKCGTTLMEALDLGPTFKIANTNSNFVTSTGTTGCIIYAPEAIYSNDTTFKTSTSTISYTTTNGIINPIYRPKWTYFSNTPGSMEVTVKGKAYENQTIGDIKINYASKVTSTLTASDIVVYMEGIQNSDIEVGEPVLERAEYWDDEESNVPAILYKFTLSNFEIGRIDGKPYTEWSGNMTLEIDNGTLTDTKYGNKNLVDGIDDIEEPENVDRNMEDYLFSDVIKPDITYVYSNTDINTGNQTVSLEFDIVDKYFYNDTIMENKNLIEVIMIDDEQSGVNEEVTKTLEGTKDIWYDATAGINLVELDATGVGTKIGKKYKLVISNLDRGQGFNYSGPMSVKIPGNIAEDKSGNKNIETIITIGIDDPEGTGTPTVVDVVKPVWIADNVTTQLNAQGKTVVTMDLIATDKYFDKVLVQAKDTDGDGTIDKTAEQVLMEEIKVLDGDGAIVNAPELQKNLEFATNRYVKVEWDDDIGSTGDYVITEADQSTANGIKYKLTLSNFEESDESFASAITSGRIYREYSGDTKIELPEEKIQDKYGNTNEKSVIDLGKIDTLKPEIIKVSSTPNSSTKTDEIIFNVTDKYFETTTELESSEILLYVDNELVGDANGNGLIDETESQDIYKQLFINTRASETVLGNNTYKTNGEIWTTINGIQQMIGMQYKLLVSNLEEATRNTRNYKDWSGTVSIKIIEGAVEDQSGNSNKEKIIDGDFVDYIKPDIEYRHGDIKKSTDKYVMTFDITDKYYSSGILTAEDIANEKIEILMQNGQFKNGNPIIYNLKDEDVTITLTATPIERTFNKTVSGAVVTGGTYTIGHTYTLTISDLDQMKIKTGLTTADYSGMITVAIDGEMIKDTSNNGNLEKTITAEANLVEGEESEPTVEIDVVDPIWKKDGSKSSVDLDTQTAIIVVDGTDTYFDSTKTSLTASDIGLYAVTTQDVGGVETLVETQLTEGINITVSNDVTPLTEPRLQNGNVIGVQYGEQYTVTITGFSLDAEQLKMRIKSGIMTDKYNNTNKTTDISLFSVLKVAKDEAGNYESTATSGFLGNHSIERQDIERIEFVKGLESVPTIDGKINIDGEKCWDVSELQDESILAWTNQTSAPYTVYIGSNDLIYANKDSSYLFSYIGYSTSCDDVELITNIKELYTILVRNMSYMFNYSGYRSMEKLDLQDNFYTKRVTNMSNMFNSCGQLKMTEINIGTNFDTSNVEEMSGMFTNLGKEKLENLDLGNTFDTKLVTNMDNMFNGCGTTSMEKLDLGPAFTKIATEHDDFMTGCGKSTLVIYAPELIYSNWTSFK